jgi:YD repeat-containing protein
MDNNIYFAQSCGDDWTTPKIDGIWRISPPLPDLTQDNIAIASEDGGELYYFTGTGKHICTVDAVTGKIVFGFGYDANGLLVTVTNLYGDVTTIQRDSGTGLASAITSPDGHKTTLGYDANGWLNSVASPAGETYSMAYTSDGLLTQFTNPRKYSSTITYDSVGRLKTDANAAGGSSTLGRTDYDNGVMISLLTGMKYNAASYAVRQMVDTNGVGYEYRENVAPDGSTSRVWVGKDGSTTQVDADGTTTVAQEGPAGDCRPRSPPPPR